MSPGQPLRFASPWILCAALGAWLGASNCATSGADEPSGHAKKHAKKDTKTDDQSDDKTADKQDDEKSGGGGVQVGEPLPAVVVKSVKGGRKIDLASMKGKVVLLDIWASWCGPCKEELPLLDDMAARLKDKNIEFVAVSIDEEKDAAEAFLSARPKWTLTVAHDPKGKLPDLLQPPKMPTSYLIDGQGVLRFINAGFERADAKKIEARLLALAAESS